MNKTIKILIVLLMLTGCFQTDKSLLEDVTDYQYKSLVCKSSCDALWTNLGDAQAKAKIAGISEERIFAALMFGRTKAERELIRLREIEEKERLKKSEELKNKCALEDKVVCDDRCCTKEEYQKEIDEADAAAPAVDDPAFSNKITLEGLKSAFGLGASIEPSPVQQENRNDTTLFQIPINIKQGMEYGQARQILIDSGWQAVNANRTPNGAPVCFLVATMQSFSFQDDVACKYNEIDACSGTGMGYCKMVFYDGDGGFLSVITSGGRPPEAVIDGWKKETSFEANVIPLDEISNYEN